MLGMTSLQSVMLKSCPYLYNYFGRMAVATSAMNYCTDGSTAPPTFRHPQMENKPSLESIVELAHQMSGEEVAKFVDHCPFSKLLIETGSLAKDDIQNAKDSVIKALLDYEETRKHELSDTLAKENQNRNCAESNSDSFNYDDVFVSHLENMKKEGRYRRFANITRRRGSYPLADASHYQWDGGENKPFPNKEVVVWCNNDYLGMGQHPRVIQKMKNCIDECGAGAGGTRAIAGTNRFHIGLENKVAELYQKESALLFHSCYTANHEAILALGRMMPGLEIYSDAKNHASLIEGMRSAGKHVKKFVFQHNDANHLEELLFQSSPSTPKLIVWESVYSMDGTISPIKDICGLAKKYNAMTLLDEVHAVGLYGYNGAGISEEIDMMDNVDIISGTLGKAVGTGGGFVTGKKSVMDLIRSTAPGFIFTTSISPAIAAAATESIEIIMSDEGRQLRNLHRKNTKLVKELLQRNRIPLIPSASHIIPVLVGNASLCNEMSEELMRNYGIYVQPINYPTVPKGTERFRLTPTPFHTKEQINHLVESLVALWQKYHVRLEKHSNMNKMEGLAKTSYVPLLNMMQTKENFM